MAHNQSKVKMWRRCQKQFAFRYDMVPGQELVPKTPKEGLFRGSWLHKLVEAHHYEWAQLDDEFENWKEVHLGLKAKFDKLFDEEKEELGDMPTECLRIFRNYLRHWKEAEEQYTVAHLEDGSPAIEFIVEADLSRYGLKDQFKGTIDLMVWDKLYGGLWIWDHKWMKTIPSADDRMMSPQALLYFWAVKKRFPELQGFVYNYGRTKPPTVPAVYKRNNQWGPAGTLSVAAKMDTDYYTYLAAIKETHGDKWKHYAKTIYKQKLKDLKNRHTLWFRRERIPIEPHMTAQALREFIISARQIEKRVKPENAPRSFFYNCRFGCDYYDLCVAQFAGLDIDGLVKAKYTTTDERYEEREEDLLAA